MKNILQSLFALLILSATSFAQSPTTGIFLKGISGFVTIDTDHDEDGNTYVLGHSGDKAKIVRYDSAGRRVESQDIELGSFVPVAFDVAGSGAAARAFVASASGVYEVNLSTGTTVAYTSPATYGLSNGIKDIVYVAATKRVVVGGSNGIWPMVLNYNPSTSGASITYLQFVSGVLTYENLLFYATLNSLAADDVGNVYAVGQTSGALGGGITAYLSKLPVNSSGIYPDASNNGVRPAAMGNALNLTYSNGWLYLMGKWNAFPPGFVVGSALDEFMTVQRFDTTLAPSETFVFRNAAYSSLANAIPANLKKFSLTADALDNVYITGYVGAGTTTFFDGEANEEKSIASASESAFVVKLDTSFKYQWIKTPIQGPFPTMGSHLNVAWDAVNSRLWWTGSFSGPSGLTMQEGADAGSARILRDEAGSQGFVAVFEPDKSFTEIVDFTLSTPLAKNRIKVNGVLLSANAPPSDSTGPLTVVPEGSSLIVGSEVKIEVPRNVYQWHDPDKPENLETDNVEAKELTIENADTRFSFLNFSVNDVVQDSSSTVYSVILRSATSVRLEWEVDYALEVRSKIGTTFSGAVETDGSRYVPALSSLASGNPSPAVGKHWIKKDSPVVTEINGAVDDLAVHPGLAIRYVPWRYKATGAATQTTDSSGIKMFPTVEPRQQVNEFPMKGPASVEYNWKLQYGVDMKSTNIAADPLLVVEYKGGPATVTTTQETSESAGLHWYDDGTIVKIAAPRTLPTTGGPQSLTGWINGDNTIFSPTEGTFNTTASSPLTSAQINAGFSVFTYKGLSYIGREVKLDRPARVAWNFGAKTIAKAINIGDSVEFTAAEISEFNLKPLEQPTLASASDGTGGTATGSDFIWDGVAKKFYPVRPVPMDLLWPTTTGDQARIRLTPSWGTPDYGFIAGSPAVSLIPHPPASQPKDLVFKKVAYTTADAAVDDSQQFTSTKSGLSVLEFSRITPSGRGGTAQSVVELKVVSTKLWNTNLGNSVDATIGQKITSTWDKARLNTGYVFFPKARYNPFLYDRTLFVGEALWDASNPPGPVIPVNLNPTASAETDDEFVVIWYNDPAINDYLLWPYKAERFNPKWPANPDRILMSSGFGSESLGADGNDQNVIGDIVVDGETVPAATTYDPARFEQVQIYSQPVRSQPGYNPNEEHALMARSLRSAEVAPQPLAAYALRENDLNNTVRNSGYTSDPYVLVQFLDKADNEFKMKVYQVVKEDRVNYPDGFTMEMKAGQPVIPFYPLGDVSGASLCSSTYAQELDTSRRTFWKDHKKTAWAVSGDGSFNVYYYYPLSPDFYWPGGAKAVGDCVAWLPDNTTVRDRAEFEINYLLPGETPLAQEVLYRTVWPDDAAILKVGETLTFAGGEYKADNPDATGLPGVLAWAAGEVVFDQLNPDMREGADSAKNPDGKSFHSYTARMISPLEERTVSLPKEMLPVVLTPASGNVKVDGTLYFFKALSSSLKKRVFYDPVNGELGIKGLLNDKDQGDSTLTAAPPAVYVLEPNILTDTERDELLGLGEGNPFEFVKSYQKWTDAVRALYVESRNPAHLSATRAAIEGGYTVGLQPLEKVDPDTNKLITVVDPLTGAAVVQTDPEIAQSYKAKGPGLALVTNPGFLDPSLTALPPISYVTLAENNDPALGGAPVGLKIIKVDRRQRYRGAIKVLLSDNVFDENIILRHTGDFGAKPEDLVFDWWYRVEDGTEALPPDQTPAGETNPWKPFTDPSGAGGVGFSQLKLKGNPQTPELLIADSLWFVRYRHRSEEPIDPVTWARNPEIPFEWAGAGNSRPGDYRAQLAQGWVKRVLDAVNPYEARIRDFTGDSPATYASMIRQFGQRYEGAVALNPDKNVIENVGLIELYSTVLDRAKALSLDLPTHVNGPGITNALLLASTRLADFYMLLGNEAYTDAQDSTIGYGSDSAEYGALAPTVFTFQNQLSSQMEEELGLLRGVDDYKARPVYNRLFWNFTKGEGEAAYATSYNISDVNQDGFINEDDAMILFPQGHGDAWGHYLTAIGGQYDLLKNPYFNWVSRSELYSLQDIVFTVDFLDERKFAQVAAAKAKAGAEIVEMTYRDSYVADPESQWQGYLDTDSKRAWGVEGWARRAGQGAYFDWVTANALLPSVHPNTSKTGIEKVDRTTVKDIAVISANMNAVQQTFEDANNGYNPLGIAGNTVPFDIDPFYDGVSWERVTHFEQIYQRAIEALNNATTVFNNANELQNMLRRVENNEVDFRRSVFEEDMAYRNQLIEIFGSPYKGMIGSGKAFPAGYQGPDTALYMYVDKQSREITADTVPGLTAGFMTDIQGIASSFPTFLTTDFRANYAPSFQTNNPSDWFGNFGGVNYVVTQGDGITFDDSKDASGNYVARVPLTNMQLPIKASGYTFEAPADWGLRDSPGELQLQVSAMIQQEAELANAIAAWDGFQGGVVRQIRQIAAQNALDTSVRGLMSDKLEINTVAGIASLGLNTGAGAVDVGIELLSGIVDGTSKFTPLTLPTAGFSFSPGDLLSTLRGAIKLTGEIGEGALRSIKLALEQSAALTELQANLRTEGLDIDIYDYEQDFAMKQALVELENMIGDEGILRVEVFRQQEALRAMSDEYRAMLQKGARLMDEREAYNKRVAELVQRNRYQDMSFRVGRNAALQRYHEAFDLAARYAYLAAKAYDYETNLHPNDAGSAQSVLTKIVSARGLGLVEDGEPKLGNGGLAEELAKLKANFEVLKGQLGLNNPQAETGRFSLRKELYRIAPHPEPDEPADLDSDTAWRDQLASKKVDNLWDMPEFRRYCRPFAAYDPAKPEPGLVIEFSSEIIAGKNFFGQALAGGDNAYDPTNFATKISSVGAWFEGYVSASFTSGLSETPRVYLVPAGTDVMMYPSDTDLGVRMWNVLDQKIPVPFPVLQSNLDDNTWRPLDTLGGTEGEIRKFSSFRAYPDSGSFDQSEMTFDSRLVGRSVWNSRWLLIIPGSTLKANSAEGLQTFIDNVSDIKLFFQTFGYSGN